MRRAARPLAIAAVAVLALAACGGDDDAAAPPADDGAVAQDGFVSVVGTDGLRFEPDTISVPAGEFTVELVNEPILDHTFTIEFAGGDDIEVVAARPGETGTGTVTLEPGTYTFYCSVPGHREGGMEGTLTVTG